MLGGEHQSALLEPERRAARYSHKLGAPLDRVPLDENIVEHQLFVAVLHAHNKMPYLEHLGNRHRVPARVLPDVDLGQSASLEVFLLVLFKL